jgi:hypothetical protein
MQNKAYVSEFRRKELQLTVMMCPFVVFRVVINVWCYASGVDLHDIYVPWVIFYITLISVLGISYFRLTYNLKTNYPEEYKEIKRSLLIFFILELTLYVFWAVFDSISDLHLIDEKLKFEMDMDISFVILYLQAICILYFKDSKDNLQRISKVRLRIVLSRY